MAPQSSQSLKFGPYRLERDQRLLFGGSQIIPLAPKVYDALLALVESGGRVADKEDLLSRVRNNAFVGRAAWLGMFPLCARYWARVRGTRNTLSPSRNAVIVLLPH
jgi:hypothetical protein